MLETIMNSFENTMDKLTSPKLPLIKTVECENDVCYMINLAGYGKDEVKVQYKPDEMRLRIDADKKTPVCNDEECQAMEPDAGLTLDFTLNAKPKNIKLENGLLVFSVPVPVKEEAPATDGFESVPF